MDPITHYVRSEGSDTPLGWWLYQEGYRQSKPFDKDLEYAIMKRGYSGITGTSVSIARAISDEDLKPGVPGSSQNPALTLAYSHVISQGPSQSAPDSLVQLTKEKARSRALSKLGEHGSLGTTLAEWEQSAQMIAKRSLQVVSVATKLRRFDFRGALRDLGVTAEERSPLVFRVRDANGRKRTVRFNRDHLPSVKARQKQFANNFLEVNFGALPLYQDIYTACQVFSDPLPDSQVRASASNNDIYSSTYEDSWASKRSFENQVRVKCSVQFRYAVSNPNLRLAEQLGLLNPVSLAWDLIPFSFVVGWFSNISSYLGQLSDTAGLDLSHVNVSTGVFSFAYDTQVSKPGNPWGEPPGSYWTATSDARSFTRETSLPSVKLRFQASSPSIGKALSSISLVIQRLVK